MIRLAGKEACVGCSACAQSCPKGCITMTADAEGFAYPAVEENLCVNCGICEKVCPMQGKMTSADSPVPETFVAYSGDTALRLESSSGGIFTELASAVLARGGAVFGAAMTEDFTVRHICVTDKTQLRKLRGSKYVQSDVGTAYRDAKQMLESGKSVLFSGTGCQIAGLKAFLGREYENLLTVDVLCHGVPSPGVWRQYLSGQEKPVSAVHFRVKEPSWRDYRFGLDFADGTALRVPREENLYMALFLRNVSLRPACYACRFKGLHRLSDITLGDCWGVETYMPHMDDNRGTSVVLVHTEKGKKLLAAVRGVVILEKADVEKALPASSDARHSVTPHPRRARFFSMLANGKSPETAAVVLAPSFTERLGVFCRRVRRKIRYWLFHVE